MIKFDASVLRADPAKIALGTAEPSVTEQASAAPSAQAPACNAAIAAFRAALIFRYVFTVLVLVVSGAAAAALTYAVWRLIDKGVDASVVVTGAAGVVTSGGAAFLVKRMLEAIKAQRQALADVGKYCGEHFANQLQAT